MSNRLICFTIVIGHPPHSVWFSFVATIIPNWGGARFYCFRTLDIKGIRIMKLTHLSIFLKKRFFFKKVNLGNQVR